MNAPETQINTMNIYQRLNEVRKAVAYLRKTKEVSGAGTYKVVTHDQVTGEIRESLIDNGVMVVPHLKQGRVADTGTFTAKQIPIIRYEALFDIEFVNCDNPQDKAVVTIESHALDQGDKAPGKAISYATKYAMLKLFSIETGEDEESRIEARGEKKDDTPKGNYKPALNSILDERRTVPDECKGLSQQELSDAEKVARKMLQWLADGCVRDAILECDNAAPDVDTKRYIFTFFDSAQRSAMKKEAEAMRKNSEKEKA